MQGELFGYDAIVGEQAASVGDRTREKAPKVFRQTTPEELQERIKAAVEAGTYSLGAWRTVCHRCREWVTGIYSHDKNNSKVGYCRKCSAELGDEDARAAIERERLQEDFNPDDIPI